MGRPIVVFEDARITNLYPLTLTRPAFDLVCGILSLGDKMLIGLGAEAGRRPGLASPESSPKGSARGRRADKGNASGEPSVWFHARNYLSRDYPESAGRRFVTSYGDIWQDQDLVTFVNARLVFRDGLFDKVDFGWTGKYVAGDTVAVANLPKDRAELFARRAGLPLRDAEFADLPHRTINATVVNYPWDLIGYNATEIANDFWRLGGPGCDSDLGPGVHLVNEDAVRIAGGVDLSPGVVVDAKDGPVHIDSGVKVMANASLCGPLHLGRHSLVKMGATIYGGTSIGPVSKVGGEVASTVFLGYSNKQHGGFVGHSYLGEWVNIGAGTNTSDMKNNYSTVRVQVAGKMVDSKELFLGLVIGDHSKSGIGSIFNAGTTIGVCSNVFGAGYPSKSIPSFAWGGASGFVEHELRAALETARRVVGRRGTTLDARGEAVLRKVFEITADARAAFLRR